MNRLSLSKRLDDIEETAASRPVNTERSRFMREWASAIRSDPEITEIRATIAAEPEYATVDGRRIPVVNSTLSERLNSPEKIEAAKRIAYRLAALTPARDSERE